MPVISGLPLTSLSPRDEFTSSGFFVLRTPLLPIEEFLQFSPPVMDADRAAVRAALRRWSERPEVREALWIASPEFVQALPTLWDQPESAKGRKLEHALYRYMARMTARSTPFGLFAGCSVGDIADSTRLELAPRSHYRRHTRLDMELLCTLSAKLSADPALRGRLRFRTNASLHFVAGRYHHVQMGEQEGAHVVQLIATDPTPAVDATLLRAASGATANDLAEALLAGDPEITREEAVAFLDRLIDSQILVAELVPPVTGAEPVFHMAGQLEHAPQVASNLPAPAEGLGAPASNPPALAEALRALAEDLCSLDRHGLGSDIPSYQVIAHKAGKLGAEFKPGRLVQVDMLKPAVALTLDRQLPGDILDAVEKLRSIYHDSAPSPLQLFKEQFRDRYQDRDVPLLEALDDEAGIGFEQEDNPTAEPVIAGIDFRRPDLAAPAPAAETPAVETPAQSDDNLVPPALARRLEELRASNEMVLELDAELLGELRVAKPLPLPDAFTVLGTAFLTPDGQTGFCLHSAFGPSGANLLARFCCDEDEQLSERVAGHIQAEEALHDQCVFAEIVHLPEGRIGNVVSRPALRRYEIPLLATPGIPADRQIALSDLTVSVRNDRVILRSRRLGAEILPRLTCAHNFAGPRSWKLYKFLCLLQHQGTRAQLFFDWGAAGKASFLPRVTLGNIVVSLACWRIDKNTALDLAHGRLPLQQWREASRVPRFVFIAEGDHQLLIDFENALAVESFIELVRKQTETVIVEMFPGPDALPVRGPEGSFVHEMVLPFTRRRPPPEANTLADAPSNREAVDAHSTREEESQPAPAGDRSNSQLEPGSDWLFVKLYCSPSHADRLLLELARPLVLDVTRASAAGAWFFVRYADPAWHLRLRFHGEPHALREHVLPALMHAAEPFERQGILWRMQFDHYEPEVERYGGLHSIGVAERLFQLDSELCLDLLPLFLSDAGADLRWKLALCGADRLLSGLGFNTEEKKAFAEDLRTIREKAWIVDDAYRQQLARTFRSVHVRQTVAAMLQALDGEPGNDGVNDSETPTLPPAALSAFDRFAGGMQILRDEWRQLQQTEKLTIPLAEIVPSLLHMHMNRALRSCHLEQETVLSDFLVRIYAAKLARGARE